MSQHYILMADIVKSSDKNAHYLMQDFKEFCSRISQRFHNDFISPITITLGDEFQSVIRSLKAGVDIILFFEEDIIKEQKHFSLRYVLNFGEIETPLNNDAAYGMLGPGLLKARNALADLKETNDRFFFSLGNQILSEKLNLIFRLYQMIVDNWQCKNLSLVGEFLRNRDYKAVAEAMNKDRSLMWRREKSLNISEYFDIKKLIEKEIDPNA
ncbi:MAG: SatD family protein [Candidatus Aminicenantes bacterium]|nr:SatD family protein [Candidatus Aminicenantes bacterium]